MCPRAASVSEALRLASPSVDAPPPSLQLTPLPTDYLCDVGKENHSTAGEGQARAPVSSTAKATTAVDMFASKPPPRHTAASPRGSCLAGPGLRGGVARRSGLLDGEALPVQERPEERKQRR